MAVLFIDGFDKYGTPGQTYPVPMTQLMSDWTANGGGSASIVAGLSAGGQAIQLNAATAWISKTFPTNAPRLVGGVRFNSNNLGGSPSFTLSDNNNNQCSVSFNVAGTISVHSGSGGGTVLATSTATFAANSTHYLEWDITIGTAANYQIWMDGASIISGNGNTRAGSSNNYANQFGLNGSASNLVTYDDVYVFDTTGTTCNAVLLNNPIVETAFPNSDSQKQWTNSATVIGPMNNLGSSSNPNNNNMYLRLFTAPVNMTMNSITVVPAASNGATGLRPVVYASLATGAALLATGPATVGVVNGVPITLPLTAPLALTGGSSYAIGFMIDSNPTTIYLADNNNRCTYYGATFTSGAPSTLPGAAGAWGTYWFWANCTGSAADYVSINNNPADPYGGYSYLSSTTVGQEELLGFTNLLTTPASVSCVAYKARVGKSDAGIHAVEVRCKSGATDTAGATAGGIIPATTFSWISNYQPTDPSTSVAWIGSGVNAAVAGPRVAS